MTQGEFSPSVFFKTSSYLLVGSLVAIYLIAVELGHEPPIPKTYISECAGHYPEFIIFRISTISGSVLTLLGWLTNHFFLKSLARERAFRIEQYRPEVAMILGLMGSMALMGSTANIDTGIRNGHWHQRCAASFFLLTSLAIAYNTFLNWLAYEKMRAISGTNMLVKGLLLLLLLIQMAISWKYGQDSLLEDDGLEGIGSEIGNVIEWTYSLTIAAVYVSMGNDVKRFEFVY